MRPKIDDVDCSALLKPIGIQILNIQTTNGRSRLLQPQSILRSNNHKWSSSLWSSWLRDAVDRLAVFFLPLVWYQPSSIMQMAKLLGLFFIEMGLLVAIESRRSERFGFVCLCSYKARPNVYWVLLNSTTYYRSHFAYQTIILFKWTLKAC